MVLLDVLIATSVGAQPTVTLWVASVVPSITVSVPAVVFVQNTMPACVHMFTT